MTSTTLINDTAKELAFTFREDGYFNMTKAATIFGKNLSDFWKNDFAAPVVSELKNALYPSPVSYNLTGCEWGTWGHPKLAVSFARWLIVQISVACDLLITDVIQGELKIYRNGQQVSIRDEFGHYGLATGCDLLISEILAGRAVVASQTLEGRVDIDLHAFPLFSIIPREIL